MNISNIRKQSVIITVLIIVAIQLIAVGQYLFNSKHIVNNTESSSTPEEALSVEGGYEFCDKPIIYVYPTDEMGDTEVNIKLTFQGKLTATYPKYDEQNGWNVIASPDGTLKELDGSREYYGLYWEGSPSKLFEFTEGNMVAGSDTAEFLETSLKTLGLTDKEAQEFIIYWLPKMQNNTYNFIQFQTSQYTDIAKLDINPAPDTLIRVFMTYRPYESIASYKIQDLSKLAVQRNGYTVVEWGGSMI